MRIDPAAIVNVTEVSRRGVSWLISQVVDEKRTILVNVEDAELHAMLDDLLMSANEL